VSYLDSSVNLHLALNLNNGFQSIKDLLNVATIKLSVPAIGSRQIETSNPIHMKVNNEVYDFGTQELQYGMVKTPLWGGHWTGLSPGKLMHLQTFPTSTLNVALDEGICQLCRRLRPGPDVTLKPCCHIPSCFVRLNAFPTSHCWHDDDFSSPPLLAKCPHRPCGEFTNQI
jgi:hypothetical protein